MDGHAKTAARKLATAAAALASANAGDDWALVQMLRRAMEDMTFHIAGYRGRPRTDDLPVPLLGYIARAVRASGWELAEAMGAPQGRVFAHLDALENMDLVRRRSVLDGWALTEKGLATLGDLRELTALAARLEELDA